MGNCRLDKLTKEQLTEWKNSIAAQDLSIVTKKNTAFAEAAGLPHIRIHDFRHSHLSYLVHKGINIQEIARRLGHADIKMTLNTYSHLYRQDAEKAVEALDKIVPK